MRFKFTAVLLLLNLIAFGILLTYRQKDAANTSQDSGLSAIIGQRLVEADRIQITGREIPTPRVLIRDGADWNLIQPMQWSANYFAVNRILNQLQFIEEKATFTLDEIQRTGQDLGDFGLDQPILEISISEDNANPIRLSIGNTTEIGNNIYLLGPDQQQIYVVSRNVIDSLLVDLMDLRNREIYNIPVFEIDALSVLIDTTQSQTGNDLRVYLKRTNAGWLFEAPITAEADPTLVANTINALASTKVIRFIQPEASDPVLQGLNAPSMRITINGNKRSQTLLLGNKEIGEKGEDNYFAQLEGNPSIFTVDAAAFDQLREAQEALRERNFMQFNPEALTAINISENGTQVRLQKIETGGWHVIQGKNETTAIQPYHADPTIIAQLISDLQNTKASGFAIDAPDQTDLNQMGFDQPRRTVTLFLQNEKEPLTLQLAHPTDENKQLYAKTNRAPYIYQVERRQTLNNLPLNALNYRTRRLDTLPDSARIRTLKLEDISTGVTLLDFALNQETTDWPTALADLNPQNQEAVVTLLAYIRNFQIEAYQTNDYQDAFPLDSKKTRRWKYRLSAQIQLPGGEEDLIKIKEYVFTERLSGTRQGGGSQELNTTFFLHQELINTLQPFIGQLQLPPEANAQPVVAPPLQAPVSNPTPIQTPPAPAAQINE